MVSVPKKKPSSYPNEKNEKKERKERKKMMEMEEWEAQWESENVFLCLKPDEGGTKNPLIKPKLIVGKLEFFFIIW